VKTEIAIAAAFPRAGNAFLAIESLLNCMRGGECVFGAAVKTNSACRNEEVERPIATLTQGVPDPHHGVHT
jgi:hypothetical protein